MNTSSLRDVPADDMRLDSQLFLFLKNGTFIVSVAAVAQVYFVSTFLSIPVNLAVVVAPLLAFGIYGINNLTDTEEDAVNLPWDAGFIRRWHRVVGALSILLHFVGVGVAFAYGGTVPGLLSLVPLTAQVVYSTAWLPFDEVKRLKQVLFLNSSVVAGAWVVNVVALPVALTTEGVSSLAAGTVSPLAAGGAGLFIFVRWIMSVEVANVPDVTGDKAADVDSIPIAYEILGTRRAMYLCELVSAALLVGLAAVVEQPLAVLSMLPVLAYTAACTHFFCRHGQRSYLSFAWDVSFVLMGALAALGDYALDYPGGAF